MSEMKLIMENWDHYLLEQGEFDTLETVGDLRKAIQGALRAKRGGATAEMAKGKAIDAVLSMIPGAGAAKSLYDIVRGVYVLPDTKKSNTALDHLNIDDEVAAIVDDSIENAFLKQLSQELGGSAMPDTTPLAEINMTKLLANFISARYDRRTVQFPGG